MSRRVATGVILAAGRGLRLRRVWTRPKGLLRFCGETLIERSLRLLRRRRVERIVVVVGHQADRYRRLLAGSEGVELVLNADYARSGSMASLARALEVVREDFLLLESDLAFQARGLDTLLAHPGCDAILASDPTGAGDEVWVDAPHGVVRKLSKDPSRLSEKSGEFVGITRVSSELAAAMNSAFARFVRSTGHARMAYDTGALSEAVRGHPVTLCLCRPLVWGEIDNARHYARVRNLVWPSLRDDDT